MRGQPKLSGSTSVLLNSTRRAYWGQNICEEIAASKAQECCLPPLDKHCAEHLG